MNTQTLGPLIVDIAGPELTPEDRQLLKAPEIGGVILFTRNFVSSAQLTELVRDIKSLRTPSLLVTVDQEGGRVQRFKDGFTRIPPMRELGMMYDKDRTRALAMSEEYGALMAGELIHCGIDLSFAPVIDCDQGVSQVIGDRSFHSDADKVSLLAGAFISGMQRAGMQACVKHFPGHGGVTLDSHVASVQDPRDYPSLMAQDLIPFKALIQSGVRSLMTAHIRYSHIDPNIVCYSSYWLKKQLRDTFGFTGVIISDDLCMNGALCDHTLGERACMALTAGCNALLVCNNRTGVYEVLDTLRANPFAYAPSQLESLYAMPPTSEDIGQQHPQASNQTQAQSVN